MRIFLLSLLLVTISADGFAQWLQSSSDHGSSNYCASYDESHRYFQDVVEQHQDDFYYAMEHLETDAGLNLQVVCYQKGGRAAYNANTITILINNSIHAGEPDGTEACIMLVRDIIDGKIGVPGNVRLAIIPVYNIGGALNIGNYSRVNQDGPKVYGFRGNAQNLDLNRDFLKQDSHEARSFARLFALLKPEVFIDNHVSDGADYQHTMTLLSTQYDKLGGQTGRLMRRIIDPAIYQKMAREGWPMIPYVNAEDSDPRRGWTSFYDPPRFGSGYAALFHTIAYVPETHMLKPFDQRVASTYAFMKIVIDESARNAAVIKKAISEDRRAEATQTMFPLDWEADTRRPTFYTFLGYETAIKASEVTGLPRMYYDRQQPYTASIPIYDHYNPEHSVKAPKAYIIPGTIWRNKMKQVMELQGISGLVFSKDTVLQVTSYHIDSFKTSPKPYEGHYKHSNIHVTAYGERRRFYRGDVLLTLNVHPRFVIELLEPTGDDSYFAWNYFDPYLQQKEGYSDYRWEDMAAKFLQENATVRQQLEERRMHDPEFAKDASAQLRFVYLLSPWHEPEHMRYPIARMD